LLVSPVVTAPATPATNRSAIVAASPEITRRELDRRSTPPLWTNSTGPSRQAARQPIRCDDLVVATEDDVRRIALSLPETDEHPSYGGRPSFRVRKKGFTWLREDGVSITLHMASLDEKEELLASDPRKFFTEPHYDGYPMVLLRYAKISVKELRELITDSWRQKAPKKVLAAFEESEAGS
jgi:hypothetical protein